MGGLVSRRKRSKVRSVSTQATECISGRVLHEVTDVLEAQKLAAVTEMTIGDCLQQTSPVARKADGFTITRRESVENKKRRGLSKVLKARPKVGKKLHTHGVDFSTQFDFLALPGQVSPTYRRSRDSSSTEKMHSPRVIKTLRLQTSAPLDLPVSCNTDKQEAKADEADPKKALTVAAAGDEHAGGGTSAYSEAVHDEAEDQADENCNILKEGSLLAELRNREVYGACCDSEISTMVAHISDQNSSVQGSLVDHDNGQEKPLEKQSYPKRIARRLQSEVDPGFRVSLEEILQNNIPVHLELKEVAAVTALQYPNPGILADYPSRRGSREAVAGAASQPDEIASTSDYCGESSSNQEPAKAAQAERDLLKQVDEDSQNDGEDQEGVGEDEEIAEDTLDWNADDRTRSPSDSRPNSISSSYAESEDLTIDPMESAVNQRQTSLTTLKDGDFAGEAFDLPACSTFVQTAKYVAGQFLPQDPAEIHMYANNEDYDLMTNSFYKAEEVHSYDIDDSKSPSLAAKAPSPVVKLQSPKANATSAAEIDLIKAPLVMPEETEMCLSSSKPTSSVLHTLQLRDVCIQKSEDDDENLSCTYTGPTYFSGDSFIYPTKYNKKIHERDMRDQNSPTQVRSADAAQQTSPAQQDNSKEAKSANKADELAPYTIAETAEAHMGEVQTERASQKVLLKLDSKVMCCATQHKSLLAMQETQAMTLLLLTGALPGEADSEGAIRGAGDAQNLENAASIDDNQEGEMDGIASMLRTQSKSSCQLEQLQAADHFESLSRLSEGTYTHPAHAVSSDDSSAAEVPQLKSIQEEGVPSHGDTGHMDSSLQPGGHQAPCVLDGGFSAFIAASATLQKESAEESCVAILSHPDAHYHEGERKPDHPVKKGEIEKSLCDANDSAAEHPEFSYEEENNQKQEKDVLQLNQPFKADPRDVIQTEGNAEQSELICEEEKDRDQEKDMLHISETSTGVSQKGAQTENTSQPVGMVEEDGEHQNTLLPFMQMSVPAFEEETQTESIPSSTECAQSSTDLAAASVEEIPEKSSSSNLGAATSTSEEDWEVIPLRRVPAHTDLGGLVSGGSYPEHPHLSTTDLKQLPSLSQESEGETAEESSSLTAQPSHQEPEQGAPPLVSFAIGDPEASESKEDQPAEDPILEQPLLDSAFDCKTASVAFLTSEEKMVNVGSVPKDKMVNVGSPVYEEKTANSEKTVNFEVGIPPAPHEEGIGDLPPPKSEPVTTVASGDAMQDDNANNSQSSALHAAAASASTSNTGKRKKKKRGGRGRQK